MSIINWLKQMTKADNIGHFSPELQWCNSITRIPKINSITKVRSSADSSATQQLQPHHNLPLAIHKPKFIFKAVILSYKIANQFSEVLHQKALNFYFLKLFFFLIRTTSTLRMKSPNGFSWNILFKANQRAWHALWSRRSSDSLRSSGTLM